MQWQYIDTAPKDGTIIVVTIFWENYRHPDYAKVVYWNKEYKEWLCCGEKSTYEDPTHWMPLSDLPETSEGETK